MTDAPPPFADTIDWDRYWREWTPDDEETYPASVSGGHFERLTRLFDRVGVPDTAAFVGCGPGTLAAAVAAEHPTVDVVGYDAATSVVERNREVHGERSNLAFETAVLPALDVDRRFDLVVCYATLYYVRDAERALRRLHELVRPGGHTVCNYPNRAFQDAHADADGELRERLQLPIEGENLLSRERVDALLEGTVRDFWALVDAEGPFVRPSNPCVVVER